MSETTQPAIGKMLFTGMDWLPVCGDGGLDRYFYEQLQSLAAAGVKGTALVSDCEPTELGGISVRPIAARGASVIQRWRGVRRLARQALQLGVELVNAHFALYAFPYLWELPRSVPLVVNFQGPWASEMRAQTASVQRRLAAGVAERIERCVYRRADRIITLSEAFRQLLHREYNVPLERIRVIPGAIHLERYLAAPPRAEARRQLGWPAGRQILFSLRRLQKRMGLEMLIDALAEVRTRCPQVLLLIGGKGPERESLQARIVGHGLEQHARLLGFVAEAELPLAYAAADCSVVPTLALEGFGLITAESLASGTAVLGTRVGATPEILEPLAPEWLFDEATAPAMARKMISLLTGAIKTPSTEACRAYAMQYGWPAVTPKILAVYREAIEERRGRL